MKVEEQAEEESDVSDDGKHHFILKSSFKSSFSST